MRSIDELTVRWPGGGEQKFAKLEADKLYTITQPANGGDPVEACAESRRRCLRSRKRSRDVKVKDTGWQKDFDKQSLLPHALSQLGPCLAWGDVNGDGVEDFYLGGSAGEVGQLRINDGKGKFTAKWVEDFGADKDCEDMGAVFFDADADGDLDLFVASGSNEVDKGAKALRDRLYLNDGKGEFRARGGGRDSGGQRLLERGVRGGLRSRRAHRSFRRRVVRAGRLAARGQEPAVAQ